jgi:hypothetical protein
MYRDCILIAVTILAAAALAGDYSAVGDEANESVLRERGCPLIAVWCDSEGLTTQHGPYLRVAIWEDGRAICAKDPEKWGSALQEGRIAPYRIRLLKKALLDTGVAELKGHCYLVPDAPVHCVTVSVGGKRRTLYWDEREGPNYGININPKPQHIAFKRCWKALNNLALVACPDTFTESKEKFSRPPKSWYTEPTIQSE